MKLAGYLFRVAMVLTAIAGLHAIDPFDRATAWNERSLGGIFTTALIVGMWMLQRRAKAHKSEPRSKEDRRALWIAIFRAEVPLRAATLLRIRS